MDLGFEAHEEAALADRLLGLRAFYYRFVGLAALAAQFPHHFTLFLLYSPIIKGFNHPRINAINGNEGAWSSAN